MKTIQNGLKFMRPCSVRITLCISGSSVSATRLAPLSTSSPAMSHSWWPALSAHTPWQRRMALCVQGPSGPTVSASPTCPAHLTSSLKSMT